MTQTETKSGNAHAPEEKPCVQLLIVEHGWDLSHPWLKKLDKKPSWLEDGNFVPYKDDRYPLEVDEYGAYLKTEVLNHARAIMAKREEPFSFTKDGILAEYDEIFSYLLDKEDYEDTPENTGFLTWQLEQAFEHIAEQFEVKGHGTAGLTHIISSSGRLKRYSYNLENLREYADFKEASAVEELLFKPLDKDKRIKNVILSPPPKTRATRAKVQPGTAGTSNQIKFDYRDFKIDHDEEIVVKLVSLTPVQHFRLNTAPIFVDVALSIHHTLLRLIKKAQEGEIGKGDVIAFPLGIPDQLTQQPARFPIFHFIEIYDAIKILTSVYEVSVVVAAGNSSQNLDLCNPQLIRLPGDSEPFLKFKIDTPPASLAKIYERKDVSCGAVVVASSYLNEKPDPFSNFGEIVDAHYEGKGALEARRNSDRIVPAKGKKQEGKVVNTELYAGTSAATMRVAAFLAKIQAFRQNPENCHPAHRPYALRAHLRASGTRFDNTSLIGVRPDRKRLLGTTNATDTRSLPKLTDKNDDTIHDLRVEVRDYVSNLMERYASKFKGLSSSGTNKIED